MAIHSSITLKRIMAAVNNDEKNPGFCVGCGKRVNGVEPDARKYECKKCGASRVYGAEQLALMCF